MSDTSDTIKKEPLHKYHRYLDEAGDTTFFGKGRVPILGQNGVSKCFVLGMLKVKEPIEPVRQRIMELQQRIASDPYFKEVPSIQKKVANGQYYLHATDDLPEVRKAAFELIAATKCSFEAVVARKILSIYTGQHGGKDEVFYADMLSHLLKNKLEKYDRLVLNVAERGRSTTMNNLTKGLAIARSRFAAKNFKDAKPHRVLFNVQNPTREPLLNIADYFCWSIQRVFERGEMRYYDFVSDKVSVVVDLYDSANYANYGNYYGPRRKLTKANAL